MPMIQSPYRRGADDGFFFGAYLTVMFFASIFSEWMPLLQLLSGAMAVCVPLTIYRFMLRYPAASVRWGRSLCCGCRGW